MDKMVIMKRLIFIICLSFIVNILQSQTEKEILSKALESYTKELPKLEKQAFKELRELDKSKVRPKNSEFSDYHFFIIPMYKLEEEYIQYQLGDSFAKYIDFSKMHNDFEAFIFKDTVYEGSLHFSDFDNSYFSVNDTNKYNKPAFEGQLNLIKQIENFEPDMVFYPDCPMFLFLIKKGKLYIGKEKKQMQPLDSILPFDEFIKENTLFIEHLKNNKYPELHKYIELQ
jgi:hypothetical protein